MRRALARGLAVLPLSALVLACEQAVTTVKETRTAPVPSVRAALLSGASAMSHFQVCSIGGAATYTFTATNYPDVATGQMTGSKTIAAGACEVLYTTDVHGLTVQNPVKVAMTAITTPGVHLTSIVGHSLFYHCNLAVTPMVCTTDDVQTTYATDTTLTYNVNGDIGAQGDFQFSALPPSLALVKTADADSVSAGSQIGFSLRVTNNGPGLASAVTLIDPLPSATGLSWSVSPANAACAIAAGTLTCTFGDLAAGATDSVHVVSPTTTQSCSTIHNVASVAATGVPPIPAAASVQVQCPSLTVTKVADSASVSAGSHIGFKITVSNTGAGAAQNVTISDPLPPGAGIAWSISPANPACSISAGTLSCAFGVLAAGASVSVHVTSPTTSASCGTYSNTATAAGTGLSPLTASATTTVSCSCGTFTIGYWKTHAGFGPQADAVTPLLPQWLGTAGGALSVHVTTAAQAVTLLSMSGNASNPVNKLYAQLLAAKLNIAAGASGAAVASTISAADAFLATHNASSALAGGQKAQVLGWMTTLDNYNNGIIGPGHCS